MKGSAPNSPATGSQLLVDQKASPKRWIDSHDSLVSTTAMAPTVTSTRSAKAPVLTRKPRSPWPRRRVTRGGSRDTNFRQRRQLHLHDLRRQRRVAHLGSELLTVRERPLHEVDHRPALRLVLRVFIEQEPRERRDRIRTLAG